MKITAMVLMGLFININALGYTVADGWTILQITNSEYIPITNDIKMSGDNIVWHEYVNGGLLKIMFWNGTAVTQISSGTGECSYPQISGSNVVWQEDISGHLQIMFWNGATVTQISSGTNYKDQPHISGSNVVWQEYIGGSDQIMFWNGTAVTQISSGTNSCFSPQISGNNVVWMEYISGNAQIMFWNGVAVTQITSGTNYPTSPQISGSNVVWSQTAGGPRQIVFWNGTTATQISSGTTSCSSPQISGNNVVWFEEISDNYQIMFWNGISTKRLRVLVSKYIDTAISISGTNLAWIERAEGPHNNIQSIHYSDSNIHSKITDPLLREEALCVISGTSIAFCAYDEDHNVQIYIVKPESMPPTQPLISDINKDNRVDIGDLSILASQWLQSSIERIQKFALDINPNWLTEGQWAFGKPMGGGGTLHGFPDPIKGRTGSNVYGVNLNGDYTVSVGDTHYLTTGPIDCSDYENVELRFERWLNTDDADYVKCTVEVSNNGTNWASVWTNSAQAANTENLWQTVGYDISQTADGQQTVYIRWGYQVLDERAFAYSGWNIDDVELWGQ